MTDESHAVVGSCLRLDAQQKQIVAALTEVINLLKNAATDYRAITASDAQAEAREAVLARTNTLLNKILVEYRKTSSIVDDVRKAAGPELPEFRLEQLITNGEIPIVATDEGYAEILAEIVSCKSPIEQMHIVLNHIADWKHAADKADAAIHKLSDRVNRGRNDKSAENLAESSQASEMIRARTERKRILEEREHKGFSYFFNALKSALEPLETIMKRMRSIYPHGNAALESAARTYDAHLTLSAIDMIHSEFKRPFISKRRK